MKMISKSILRKISELENLYPPLNFDIDTLIKEILENIKILLGYSIEDRLKFNTNNFKNKTHIYTEILNTLTIEELKVIAYAKK